MARKVEEEQGRVRGLLTRKWRNIIVSKPLFLDVLKERVIIYDGAMGTNLQVYNLTKEDFGGKEGLNDYLVLTKPNVVREVHEGFLKAGAECPEANTVGSQRLTLADYSNADHILPAHTAAA